MYKMYNNISIKITLFSSLLFCILTIVISITIINYSYHHSDNQQFSTPFYIQAKSDNKDNDKKGEDKDKNKTKEKKKIKKQEKSEEEYDNNWTRADQNLITKYNYRNLAIPKIYQNAPDGEAYRFNKTNPNDKVQIDKTDKSNVFTKQNKDGSWRIDFGKPRIDIHTKDAGILPDKVDQLNNLSEGKIQSWNYSELKDIGYWYKPSDWKNTEVTLIFKLLDSARSKGEQHSISIVTNQ